MRPDEREKQIAAIAEQEVKFMESFNSPYIVTFIASGKIKTVCL
jgi:hypothetical protein